MFPTKSVRPSTENFHFFTDLPIHIRQVNISITYRSATIKRQIDNQVTMENDSERISTKPAQPKPLPKLAGIPKLPQGTDSLAARYIFLFRPTRKTYQHRVMVRQSRFPLCLIYILGAEFACVSGSPFGPFSPPAVPMCLICGRIFVSRGWFSISIVNLKCQDYFGLVHPLPLT